jgi:mono/diheme cytochrome c family protein
MRKLGLLTVVGAAAALLVLLSTAPVVTVGVAQAAEPPDGKQIFLAPKCNRCHSIPPAGIEATTTSDKLKGPDLVDLDHDAEWLEKYLIKEVELCGKLHKKELKGTDEVLDAVVDWLLAQKTS